MARITARDLTVFMDYEAVKFGAQTIPELCKGSLQLVPIDTVRVIIIEMLKDLLPFIDIFEKPCEFYEMFFNIGRKGGSGRIYRRN
jgi:hypothetical protein